MSDDTSTILERFRSLAISENITKKSKRYKELRRQFIAVEVNQGFANFFGGNTSSLQSWQDICRTVGVGSDELTSIRKCKAALKGKYVNIVDLVDARSRNVIMEPKKGVFNSEQELREYTNKSKKIFPKNDAKATPLLRRFLITLSLKKTPAKHHHSYTV